MFSDIVAEFEKITKFSLLDYLEQYRDFMQEDFTYLSAYYSGNSTSVDTEIVSNFNDLLKKGKTLMQQFINFSHRLSNCGFWELQEYCQDLYDTLEKINKLPKYYRTSKTARGNYQPYVQVKANIGGMKTVKDLAEELNSNGVSEVSLIIDNDLQEKDWEIDKLSQVTAFISNRTDIVVESILEQPIGNKVYGCDIDRKITLKDNDLVTKQYEDNIDQKVEVLLELEAGDIPEMPTYGRNRLSGTTMSNYNYAELVQDLQAVFLQDDMFESVSVSDVNFDNGDLLITCTVSTKYAYVVQRTIKI